MTVVAVMGTATAVLGATIALVQTDIKKVLAYSTVSQLGYMFLACGVGAFGVGVFHLFTHAFFKALLFLGSGSVIHALGGEQDMRKMGGLWRRIPWTFGTFAVGTLAIAGIPPLAGFWSKDEILAGAYSAGWKTLFAIGATGRAAHRVLHDARGHPHLLRLLPGRRGDGVPHPRVAVDHAGAAGDPGHRQRRRRLHRHPALRGARAAPERGRA